MYQGIEKDEAVWAVEPGIDFAGTAGTYQQCKVPQKATPYDKDRRPDKFLGLKNRLPGKQDRMYIFLIRYPEILPTSWPHGRRTASQFSVSRKPIS